jgi:hypothetical protein
VSCCSVGLYPSCDFSDLNHDISVVLPWTEVDSNSTRRPNRDHLKMEVERTAQILFYLKGEDDG